MKPRPKKVHFLPKAIQLVYDRARVWALTCLIAKLMFFSVHCTAYLPIVTSSTLVSSELMRSIAPPQRWRCLGAGEHAGRGTYITYAWTVCAIHKGWRHDQDQSQLGMRGKVTNHSFPPHRAGGPMDPSLLLDSPIPGPSPSTVHFLHSLRALTWLARVLG